MARIFDFTILVEKNNLLYLLSECFLHEDSSYCIYEATFFNSMFDRDKVLIGNRDKVFIGDTKVSIVYHHFIDNRDKIYLDSIKRKHKWRSCLH